MSAMIETRRFSALRRWGQGLRAAAARARGLLGDALRTVGQRADRLRSRPRDTLGGEQPAHHVRAAPSTAGPQSARRSRGRLVARVLSGVVAGLMAGASAVGLWRTGLYQDPAPVAAMLRGYDLVALLVSPVLAGAVAVVPQMEGRAELLSASVLAYAAYHYAGYVFGAAFNALFLAHVAVFGLSVAALVLTLRSLDVRALAARFAPRTPVRRLSGLLAFLAVTLGGMWISYSVRFAVTGAAPAESKLVLPMSWIHLGYVLDLVCWCPVTPRRRCCCGGGPRGATSWAPSCSPPAWAANSTT